MIVLTIIYSLIFGLIVSAISVISHTRSFQKNADLNCVNLQNQFENEIIIQSQIEEKNNYLKSYNELLLTKLFEITKALFLVKKIIFEERY
ncbi:hypothetical protein [Bizionia myxarmorum]|uniref:hypothetical protein n=1 Tax=Bizionia myxarmorum TaxID=291186 RepID=UPI001B8735C8|nr:hypothetical protein [Bizionia myxarmorum]